MIPAGGPAKAGPPGKPRASGDDPLTIINLFFKQK